MPHKIGNHQTSTKTNFSLFHNGPLCPILLKNMLKHCIATGKVSWAPVGRVSLATCSFTGHLNVVKLGLFSVLPGFPFICFERIHYWMAVPDDCFSFALLALSTPLFLSTCCLHISPMVGLSQLSDNKELVRGPTRGRSRIPSKQRRLSSLALTDPSVCKDALNISC